MFYVRKLLYPANKKKHNHSKENIIYKIICAKLMDVRFDKSVLNKQQNNQ